MSVRFKFLGTPRVEVGERPVKISNLHATLLAYLAVEKKKFTRSKLAGIIWGEQPEEKAKQSLRQAILDIKRVLPTVLLVEGREYVSLNLKELEFLDIWEFETAFRQGLFKQVVELYEGDFLEGLSLNKAPDFENWHRSQQARYQQMVVEALELLLRQADERRELTSVLHFARRLVTTTPWHEEAYQCLMLCLARLGRFNEALAVYNQCKEALQSELGITPTPETTAAYKRVQLARLATTSSLPIHATPFIGRSRELREIMELLAKPDCRLLTLIGTGGTGKTRLAVEVAQLQKHLFLHNIQFVSLAVQDTYDEDSFLISILRALNLPITTGNVRDQLINYLRPREMLLVLDNFEHLAEMAFVLSDILRGTPDIKIILTSRERLDIQEEWVYDIQGMAFPPKAQHEISISNDIDNNILIERYDAINFFQQCVQRLKPDFSLKTHIQKAVEICQFVQGMPLAIELVASWAYTMSLPDMANKILNERDLLGHVRNFPERQRSLYVVFEHSWQLLSLEEKQVLSRLAVFRGSFSAEAAANVAHTTDSILENLTKKSLLVSLPDRRYELHDLLQIFAREKLLLKKEENFISGRHCDYYSQFVEAKLRYLKGPEQVSVLQELEEDFANIQSAWSWGIENAKSNTLSILMEGLFQLCNIRNWYTTGIRLFQPAHEQMVRRKINEIQSHLLLHESLFHLRLGQFDLAFQCVEKGLNLGKTQANQMSVARAFYVLGCVYYDTSQYNKAENSLGKSLNFYRAFKDQEAIAGCLQQLGSIACARTHFSSAGKIMRYKPPGPFICEHFAPSENIRQGVSKARVNFEKALQIYRRVGHLLGEATALHDVGYTWYLVKNYETATDYFRKAVLLLRELNAASELTHSLTWLAWTLHWQGKTAEAKAYFLEALEIGLAALTYKRLLDCLQKFSLFWWVSEKDNFTALTINVLVAQDHRTDARMRAIAEEWIDNIKEFMTPTETDKAIALGISQTLENMVYMLLANCDTMLTPSN